MMHSQQRKTVCQAMAVMALFFLPSLLFSAETSPPASAASASASSSVAGTTATLAGPPLPLTWAECVRLAVKNSPDLQVAREGVLNSDAVKRGAYATLYPQLRLSFGDTRRYQGPGLGVTENYSSAYQEQVALTQTIFDGFATKGNIEQGKAQLALAFATLNAQKAATSYAVKSSFAQLLYAQALLGISRDVIDIRDDAARLVQRLYEGGQEDKGAMLLSRANYDKSVNDLEQAQRTFALSGRQLAVAVGLSLPAPVSGKGELATAEPISETEADFDKLAVATPSYYQRKAAVDAAAAGITQANSGWYPTLTAGVAAGRTGGQWPADAENWSAGFSATLPVFNGGSTYFNVKAATASFRQTLAALSSGNNASAYALAQAYLGLLNARDNVRMQQELLDANLLRYRIAEARYKNGLMTFQDFNSIVDTYVGQKKSTLAAQRDAVIAEASWEQARGLGAIP